MKRLPIATAGGSMRRLGTLLMSHKKRVSLVLVTRLFASAGAAALPWILGRVIDGIGSGKSLEWVYSMIALAAVLVIFASIMAWLSELHAHILGQGIFARLRNDLMSRVTQLPLSVVENAGSGDLLGRTTHDVDRVNYVVREGAVSLFSETVYLLVLLGTAFVTSPLLALMLLLATPGAWWGIRQYLTRTIPAYQAISANMASVDGIVTENIEQASSVDSFHLLRARQKKIDALVASEWRTERYAAWMRVKLFYILSFSTLLPLICVMLAGAVAMPMGIVTAGQITAVALLGYQARGPVWELAFLIDEVQFASVSLQRIFGVDEVEPDREESGQLPASRTFEAQNVTYAYREGSPVLHDVNLTLVPGETLAIVGPSGAGKSTFGRMLAGIHPPTSGHVRVGGVDLVNLSEEQLRRTSVLITQEHHVFVGTLADNVRLATPNATDAELLNALEAVGAREWVNELPRKLDTRVGAGGVELTPPQAQQIALARIVLMDPDVVVLDEATSLLDASSACSVEASLARVLHGRTVVAIAHRLHTAHNADRVAVMIDGRITELGTHDELIAHGGEYASLWESWSSH
ncbi:MAG: ABC transporter ATP-binding protein [Actinobacteria bacterium]|nr:MAG: ABC transporter ATP-binding protein [Actinomycetota bacterium]